jgi:hypothetical protein
MYNTFTILKCVEIISRICGDVIIKSSSLLDKDVASSNYVAWKKAVKFHEMNASIKPSHQNDTFVVVRTWIMYLFTIMTSADMLDLDLGIVALYR